MNELKEIDMLDAKQTDTVDRLVGLTANDQTYQVRHQRDKVVAATQGSENGLFDPALEGLTVTERLYVAFFACVLTPAPVREYTERLIAQGGDAEMMDFVAAGALENIQSPRLHTILKFTHTLITDPVKADRQALLALPQAGLSTPEVVTLAQLIAFVSYQVRLVAGLKAMKSLEKSA
jgi:uncharacterized protein YciW